MSVNICEWKPTYVFQDYYMVSNCGDVKSLRTGRILKSAQDKNGYLYYVLCVNGNRKTVKAHRLVALAFIDNSECKPTVDHINGIKTDNRVCNLRWATNKEQTNNPITKKRLDAVHRMTDYKAMSALGNFGRKPVLIVWKNGKRETYKSLKDASEATGKSYAKLSEIINGKRKQDKLFYAIWASEIEEFPIAVTKLHFPEEEDEANERIHRTDRQVRG